MYFTACLFWINIIKKIDLQVLASRCLTHVATTPADHFKFISDRDGSMLSAADINFELDISGFKFQFRIIFRNCNFKCN